MLRDRGAVRRTLTNHKVAKVRFGLKIARDSAELKICMLLLG